MAISRPCTYCSAQLEPAQELRFLVESDNLDNPEYLAAIRQLPSANGRPVPVCQACQTRVTSRPRTARTSSAGTSLLTAVGLFTLGWLVHSFILGPRE